MIQILAGAKLFDGNTSSSSSIVTATTLPQSVTVETAVPTAVRSVAIWSGSNPSQTPRDFTLEWSDNGTSWTAAQAFTGASWSTTYQRRDFVVASDPGARFFGMVNAYDRRTFGDAVTLDQLGFGP